MASLQDAAFFCIPEDKLSETKRHIYGILCIISATLGLCGSIWQIFRWRPLLRGHENRRKPSPNALVIVSLAVADLLACLGVISRSIAMLVTLPPRVIKTVKPAILIPQIDGHGWVGMGYLVEAWNQYFYGVTYMWTMLYAVDIFMQLSFKNPPYRRYIILAWTIPITVTVGSLLAVIIHDNFPNSCARRENLIAHYSFYYLFVLVALITNPVFFFITARLVKQRVHESGIVSSQNRSMMLGIQKKFLAVVIVFTICWLPNVIDGALHIMFEVKKLEFADMAKYFPLWALEAILNPLQGLLNCFIYNRHVLFQYGRPPETNSVIEDRINEKTPILYRSDLSGYEKESYT